MYNLDTITDKYPELSICLEDLRDAFIILRDSYRGGGKLLVCGNGGSAADGEHIVGELMKGFLSKRCLPMALQQKFIQAFPQNGSYLAAHLQGALPTISLASHTALMTAFANDVAADMVFAQQVYGYGRPGDVLLGISTSGNSINVVHALQVARALSLPTLGLTGRSGGRLRGLCDVTICVPWDQTHEIQERHLVIYHALCAMLEKEFFPDEHPGGG
jgi:phosphoheptose isomerase